MTLRKISRSLVPNILAQPIRVGSTRWAPVYALSVMFVKEPIKIMAYLGSSPTPNHRMTSGIQAMGGMGRINSNKGLMIASA